MANPRNSSGRKRFGILLDLMHYGYQETILSGAIDFCHEHDVELYCFVAGTPMSETGPERGRNILFTMADEANVDGLIIITTALQNRVGKNVFNLYLSRYYPLPYVSIGEETPDYPSLTIDNEKGLTALLNHLADGHGYRRIAFITGPRLNSEAQTRFRVYRDFLKSRGWPYDEALVVEGFFTGISGRLAVARLLDERKAGFDVILASNDLMAFGAIEELESRGIHVPGQAFVVGFDDMGSSKNAALTTIRQPLYQEGYIAARTLLDTLEHKTPAAVVRLPTELVVRESCGCVSPNLAGCDTWSPERSNGRPAAATGEAVIEAAAAEAASHFPATLALRGWLETMSATLSSSFDRGDPAEFLLAWSSIMHEASARRTNLSSLEQLISSLRRALFAVRSDAARWCFYEDQFHRARVMLEESVRKVEAARGIFQSIQEQKLDLLGNQMSAAADIEGLYDLLARELPLLGIASCYLSLFEASLETARLVFAFDERGRIRLAGEETVFPVKALVPGFLQPPDRNRIMAVHALVHQEKNLGFVLLELGGDIERATVLEYVRMKLSVTLQYMILIGEISSQAASLERFNHRLEQSNRALQEFAYVASHDLQEPLRKITAFGERLGDRSRSALDEQGKDYLQRMQNAAVRMQKLIDSLLSYSRVETTAKPFVSVDVNQVVKGVLSDLEVSIEKSRAQVTVGDLPAMNADPTQLRQLFQNLIGNALKFQRPGAQPVVRVSAAPAAPGAGPVFVVEDNGIGIEPRFHEKIFGVFQRLHSRDEYEGSGIGLAVCKKIVERHGGVISVESAAGAGTKFIIRFGAGFTPPDRG
jgi:signal transduction histidine kinase/DNA-binding LacI/PurR family transcriptional regulator